MHLNLAGKTALITGSSRGIGLAIAQSIYAEGCNVVLNSRNKDDLVKILPSIPGAIGISGDVTKPAEAQRIVFETLRAFGKLDILICNVGGGQSMPPGEESCEEWDRMLSLNLLSTVNTVSAARDSLSKSGGAIICISSICGLEMIAGAPVTYSVAKAALHAYVRGMARPLGREGIRINAIAVGNIFFEGSVWDRKLKKDKSAVEAMLKKEVALNCLGAPKDVASLAVYLASLNARFATGSIWTLDGGQVRA